MASLYQDGGYHFLPFGISPVGDYSESDPESPQTPYLYPNTASTIATSFTHSPPQKPHNYYQPPLSYDYLGNDYDYFVNGVISHVLFRIEEDPTHHHHHHHHPHHYDQDQQQQQQLSPPEQLSPLSSSEEDSTSPQGSEDLYWGSDLCFGPNGYQPPYTEPVTNDKENNLLDIFDGYLPEQPSLSPPEPTSPAPKQASWSVSIPEGGDGDETYRTKRKKRRRLLHIIAERNRRRTQNDLYEELYRIVPGLDQARSTKREVLERTADWAERLTEGNKQLEEQLKQLQGRSGTD